MVIAANMAVETCKLIRIDLKHSHHKKESTIYVNYVKWWICIYLDFGNYSTKHMYIKSSYHTLYFM